METGLEAAAWLAAGILTAVALAAVSACGTGGPPGAVGYVWEPELIGEGMYADGPHGRIEVALAGKRVFDDGTTQQVSELRVWGRTLRILTDQSPVWREFGSVKWREEDAVVRHTNGGGLSDSFSVEVNVHGP